MYWRQSHKYEGIRRPLATLLQIRKRPYDIKFIAKGIAIIWQRVLILLKSLDNLHVAKHGKLR